MPLAVRIERGTKRVFATAADWPGLSRSGRDEAGALEAVVAAAPRYRRALARRRIRFTAPRDTSGLAVVGRSKGDATTDFGAPAAQHPEDPAELASRELGRLSRILEACWAEFDAVASSAKGKTLRSGPRGGGRDLAKMTRHVVEADAGYIGALGGKYRGDDLAGVREAFLASVSARARGEVPDRGPRGGVRWTPRFAVRRSAWHWLDHAWEIEDRMA